MKFLLLSGLAAAGIALATEPRYILYYDQWHRAELPDKSLTAGITHVVMSFANSSLFASTPGGEYTPFQPLPEVRALFDHDIQVCLAIGGWGDTVGFGEGAKSREARKNFAKNVADTLDRLGYDCVDVDWEYPGGNGADYKQIPNSAKTSEIKTYPQLLHEIKKAVGKKTVSIAVPGKERDMIAYTSSQVPKINKAVDFVNVMTYDLLNRRDNYTAHHASLVGSALAIDKYISLGFPPEKLVLGFPFYAKYATTKEGYNCANPTGCPLEVLEDPVDGSDTGKSGTVTFQKANFVTAPTNLTLTPDATCGAGTSFQCAAGFCCAASGWCGDTAAHCNAGCQSGYGKCDGVDVNASFQKALAQGRTDDSAGGQWYWDAENRLYWTWDTAELITKKIAFMASTRGVRSIMAWSLGQDSHDWSRLKAMQEGFRTLGNLPALFLLDYGADKFIDHTAVVAGRTGISPAIIALLTAGAEWEELIVVVAALAQGRPSLAMGNAVGSAISNILGAFSLGLLFRPGIADEEAFDKSCRTYSAVLTIITAAVSPAIYLSGNFGLDLFCQICGIVLVVSFGAYIISIGWAISRGSLAEPEGSDDDSSDDDNDRDSWHHGPGHDRDSDDGSQQALLGSVPAHGTQRTNQNHGILYHIVHLLFGFLSICLAGFILSHAAINITTELGVSDMLFGVVVLSLATTLPEKFIALMSGKRGHMGILVANTAGSNIFLLTLCLGVIMIDNSRYLHDDNVKVIELTVLCITTLGFSLTVWFGRRLLRAIGAVMLLGYLVFLVLEVTVIRESPYPWLAGK
ncbi:Chitinase 1 [Paramyrothecium foliicola]|nr:Chitinase 1 [Paramyrothecium foliicola]